jgi:hypothetical protein
MDYFLIYFGIGFVYVFASHEFKEHFKTQETIKNAIKKACLLLFCMLLFPIFIFFNIISHARSQKHK